MERVAAATAAGLALFLLFLSLPRLQADLAMQEGNQIKDAYLRAVTEGDTTLPSPAELEAWAQSRHDALDWLDSAEAWQDLALVNVLRAWQAPQAQERRDFYAEARSQTQHALARNPSSGLMWLRLAVIEANMGYPAPNLLVSLNKSIDTAPYEPSAFYNRMMLGFRHWDVVEPSLREKLLQQLPMMAEARDWNGIKRLAARHPEHISTMRQRLQENARALAAIDKAEEILARD